MIDLSKIPVFVCSRQAGTRANPQAGTPRVAGDTIIIGEGEDLIVIELLEVRPGGKVRVAVKCANRKTPIHRGEVWMTLQENAEVAA